MNDLFKLVCGLILMASCIYVLNLIQDNEKRISILEKRIDYLMENK